MVTAKGSLVCEDGDHAGPAVHRSLSRVQHAPRALPVRASLHRRTSLVVSPHIYRVTPNVETRPKLSLVRWEHFGRQLDT